MNGCCQERVPETDMNGEILLRRYSDDECLPSSQAGSVVIWLMEGIRFYFDIGYPSFMRGGGAQPYMFLSKFRELWDSLHLV